jgi:hypothetical protein
MLATFNTKTLGRIVTRRNFNKQLSFSHCLENYIKQLSLLLTEPVAIDVTLWTCVRESVVQILAQTPTIPSEDFLYFSWSFQANSGKLCDWNAGLVKFSCPRPYGCLIS